MAKFFIWHNILVERWERGSFNSSLTWLLSFKRVFPFCALRHFRLFFILNDLNQWRQSGEKEAEKKKVFPWNFLHFQSKPLIALLPLTNHELFPNQGNWIDQKCNLRAYFPTKRTVPIFSNLFLRKMKCRKCYENHWWMTYTKWLYGIMVSVFSTEQLLLVKGSRGNESQQMVV